MSEQLNNPEQRKDPTPLFDDCDNCEKRYQLTPANSGVRHYPKQSECDYILCMCPHCKYRTRIFIGSETLQGARDNNLQVLDDEPYAEPEIYHKWLELNGIELPKTYKLTDRHEQIIRHFGETILKVPDSMLYDFITDEHDRPYPQRWI